MRKIPLKPKGQGKRIALYVRVPATFSRMLDTHRDKWKTSKSDWVRQAVFEKWRRETGDVLDLHEDDV